ncbi:hypothetical protein [Phormidium sp. CCY1219]|uniref:hypothetical protein n=1 Tax=Phormidium sp. CCY1219 TaxID=2886104 RepID=UPI002D1ECC42|nr:hypothetical protein [Phormidium sp. CCY1219]MEB3827498.1 hypothetical protein [Phormidium sp. CCY1219]
MIISSVSSADLYYAAKISSLAGKAQSPRRFSRHGARSLTPPDSSAQISCFCLWIDPPTVAHSTLLAGAAQDPFSPVLPLWRSSWFFHALRIRLFVFRF